MEKEQKIAWFILLMTELFLLYKTLPFFKNNLLIWDMAGHYYSAWFTKTFLFPGMIGWDHLQFLGFPHHQFYPPLFHYLVALGSFLVSLELAFKILVILSVLLLPLSFYYCARSFQIDYLKSILISLSCLVLSFLPYQFFSGNGPLEAGFNIGLVTNLFALPFFFFYLGSLARIYLHKNKSFFLPTFLLSIIILSHIYTAMAAILTLISFFVAFSLQNKEKINILFLHSCFSFLLTSFWTIPFLVKISSATTMYQSVEIISHTWLIVFLSLFLISYFIFIKKKFILTPLFILFINLTLMLLLNKYFHLPIHYFRFIFIFYSLFPFFAFSALPEKIFKKSWIFFFLLFLFLLVFYSSKINYQGIDAPDLNTNNFPKLNERLLVLKNLSPGFHVLNNYLPMNTFNKVVKGLFIESGSNNKQILELEKEITPYLISWGTIINEAKIKEISSDEKYPLIKQQLHLFGVNYLLIDQNQLLGMNLTYLSIINLSENYLLVQIDNSSLIELLPYSPQPLYQYWDKYVNLWFLSNVSRIVVKSKEKLQFNPAQGNETMKILKEEREELAFEVNSTKAVPILIKISYFPNWKAYENGIEIPVYQASPSLMLIYGKGFLELKYESIWADNLGITLTIMGIILTIIIFFKSEK